MAIAITSPATRADVLAVLMRGARAGATMRLLTSDLTQLGGGHSYTLRDGPLALGVAGFWPVENPPPELAVMARGRTVYMLWLIAGAGLPKHLPMILDLGRGYIETLRAAGALVVAEIDPEWRTAPRLARAVGLVPRQAVHGHVLWASDADCSED